MIWKELVGAISSFDKEQRLQWLHALGSAMTISARAGYPAAQQGVDSIPHLVAFNELQHQLFNYLGTPNDRTAEQFIDGLRQRAASLGVEGDFVWAIRSSIDRVRK